MNDELMMEVPTLSLGEEPKAETALSFGLSLGRNGRNPHKESLGDYRTL